MPEIDYTQFGMFLAMCGGFAFIWRTVNKGHNGKTNGHSTVNTPAIREIKTLVETTAGTVDKLAENLTEHRSEVKGEFTRHTEVMAKLFDQDKDTNLRVSDMGERVATVEGKMSGKRSG